jgi:hypothetical protein
MNRRTLIFTALLLPLAAFAADPAPAVKPDSGVQLNEIGRLHVLEIGSTADEKRLRDLLNKQLAAQGYKVVPPDQAQGIMTVKLWSRKALNGRLSYYVNALVATPEGTPVWNGFPGKRATEPGSPALKSVDDAATLVVKRFFEDWTRSADVAEKIDAATAASPAP